MSRGKLRKLENEISFEGYFESIYTEFFKPLYLYARSLTRSDELAKDVVSEVFFSLWKTGSDLSHIQEIRSYLFRSVKNQVIRTLTSDPRNFENIDTETRIQEIEKLNPEDILLEKELVQFIQECISKLPDQCALIFEMSKNQQLSYAEIAEELGISQSTIKTQISRAVSSIRTAIELHYDSGEKRYRKFFGNATLILVAQSIFILS